MITSAALAASEVFNTLRPAASALARDLLSGIEADHHVHAGIAQIQRVGVALAAIAYDGYGAALQVGRVVRLFRNNRFAIEYSFMSSDSVEDACPYLSARGAATSISWLPARRPRRPSG